VRAFVFMCVCECVRVGRWVWIGFGVGGGLGVWGCFALPSLDFFLYICMKHSH